ncbi:MAG: universal stress protein [Gammaproteobacteria bacterium]
MYQHILIATDLGTDSEQLCARAHQLVKLTGAKVSLLHVIEAQFSYGYAYSWPQEFTEQILEEVRELMANLGERYQIAGDNQIIEEGVAKVKILEVAQNINADCIVVGTHTKHGLQGLIGSTASAVLRHSPVDVLTVVTR